MSRFDIEIDAPLSTEITLLPKNTELSGVITGRSILAGETEKGPWVIFNLKVTCRGDDVKEILGRDEVTLYYTPPVFLQKNGKINKDNVAFAKLQDLTNVSKMLTDKDFREMLLDGTEEIDELPKYLQKYYDNMAKFMEGTELQVVVGQRKRDSRDAESELQNYIVKIAAAE